jgi:hypothetical protein
LAFLHGLPLLGFGIYFLLNEIIKPNFIKNTAGLTLLLLINIIGLVLVISGFFIFKESVK